MVSFLQQVVVMILISSLAIHARTRGEDRTISLLIAVPLSKDNRTELDPGFFHLAAARLAVDHFNARVSSVLPDLGQYTQGCNITFGEVRAVDTGTDSHRAMELVVQQLQNEGPWDSIAGPYNEIPGLELSVLATGMQAPLVAHRSMDYNLLLPQRHPYFSQVGADFYSEMSFVGTYLQHIQRTNYVAIVYCAVPSVAQKMDVLRRILARRGFDQVREFSYTPSYLSPDGIQEESIHSVLEGVKKTGFRTIVVLPNRLELDAVELGPAATLAGLDQGDHFWAVASGEEPRQGLLTLKFFEEATTKYKANFLNGSSYLHSYDGYEFNNHIDFRQYLQNLEASFFQRVLDFLPVSSIPEQLSNLKEDPFPFGTLATDLRSWLPGASFMYDAVMAIGLGACMAVKGKNSTAMSGEMHLRGIRSLDFMGISGEIKFGNTAGHSGSRAGNTIPFGAANIAPRNGSVGLVVQAHENLDPRTGNWTQTAPFLFADGTRTPPTLLREQPEQNYIAIGARVFGLTVFAIALVTVALSLLWVALNRHHSVVVAAQPVFLYTLCFASLMLCFTILLSAFDEGWDLDKETLNRSCFAWVWLDSLGRMIAYSALFTKLWRANRCMRYNTNRVALWQVLWPCTLLVLSVIICLTIWTIQGDYGWERQVIDEVSGESVGLCTGETTFLASIYALSFIPIILACIMAWKTIGIDDLYSDSKWVLAFILVQIQVLVLGAPLLIILHDTNPSGRYIGQTLLTFSFPVSCMGLIILPKAMIVRRMRRKGDNDNIPSTHNGSLQEESETINVARQSLPPVDERVPGIRPRMQIVTWE